MLHFFSTHRLLTAGLFSTFIIATSLIIVLTGWANKYPELYTGVTYDLMLFSPLCFYFISGRKAPKFLIGLFVSAGVITAYFLLPDSQKLHFNLIRFVFLPLVEIAILGSVIYFSWKTIRGLRNETKATNPDYYSVFQNTGVTVLQSERAGKIFGSELAMFYYFFSGWKTQPISADAFAHDKNSGSLALFWVVVLILMGETLALHLMLHTWSAVAAWIFTGLSIYTVVMILAHINAYKNRPHELGANELILRNGIFGTLRIPYGEIAEVTLTSKDPVVKTKKIYKMAILGEMESHNVIVTLKNDLHASLIYGISKTCDTVLFDVDNSKVFKARLDAKILQQTS